MSTQSDGEGARRLRPIRVLVVDDSALVRSLLTEMLAEDRQIEVVGTAADAHVAREKIKKLNPDVLTLDVEMPKMDGITFLRNLMRLRPMPVVMVSSLTERGADVTLDALAIGAVDWLAKPKIDVAARLKDYAEDLIAKIKSAATATVRAYDPRRTGVPRGRPAFSADAVLPAPSAPRPLRTTERILAIGGSTGGTEAIKEVLMGLPPDSPAVLIVQHIPKAFSAAFARRLDDCCALTVCEARDGQQVLPGHAYVAPGDQHLVLQRDGARYVCRLDDAVPVNRHKPSVDVLFRSVARAAPGSACGVLLTGMGKDGARGLLEIRASGSATIAQDEASSVVWGMPREAVVLGAAQEVLTLEAIASRAVELLAAPGAVRTQGRSQEA